MGEGRGGILILIVNILEINILNLGSQHTTLTPPSWRSTNGLGCVETQRPRAKDKTVELVNMAAASSPSTDGRSTGRKGGWRDGRRRKTGEECREMVQELRFCYLDGGGLIGSVSLWSPARVTCSLGVQRRCPPRPTDGGRDPPTECREAPRCRSRAEGEANSS